MSTPNTNPQPAGRRRGRALGIAAASVLALAAVGGGGLVYGISQAQGPIDTAKAYCADLKAQKYDDAYALLSSGYQARESKTDFETDSQLHDQIDGKVVDCGQPNNGNFTWSLGNTSTQALDTQIKRENNSSTAGTGKITLVKQGDSWKVDSLADSLQGTDLGGYKVSKSFCADFVAKDYAGAYGLLSAKGQQNYGSEAQFESAFSGTFTNGLSLTQCDPDITTYKVTSPSAQITAKLSLTFTTSAGTSNIPLPNGATLRLAQNNGIWQVDELDLNIPNA